MEGINAGTGGAMDEGLPRPPLPRIHVLWVRAVASVSRHRREMRSTIHCGCLFVLDLLPIHHEQQQIVLLNGWLIIDEREASSVDHVEVVTG